MKKSLLMFIPALALLFGGCGQEQGEYVPQTADEANAAIDKIYNMTVATSAGTALTPGDTKTLDADANDSVIVTILQEVQVNGKTVKIELDWEFKADGGEKYYSDVKDENGKYLAGFSGYKDMANDPLHKIVYFSYPTHVDDVEDKTLHVAIRPTYKVKLSDGTYVTKTDDDFLLDVPTAMIYFEPLSIAEFYAIDSETKRFRWLTKDNVIGKNYNLNGDQQQWYYVAVSGKLVYLAADNNFGLLQDGDLTVYLYKVNELSEKPVVGKYYTFYAEVGHYNGAAQLTFISRFEELADHSNIAEPSADHEVTIENIRTWAQISDKHQYNVVLKNVEWKGEFFDKSGKATTSPDFGNRVTYTLKQGDLEITAAYDYHTKTGEAIKAKLTALAAGATIKEVHGRLAYNGSKVFTGDGSKWQLLVINAEDIVLQ